MVSVLEGEELMTERGGGGGVVGRQVDPFW